MRSSSTLFPFILCIPLLMVSCKKDNGPTAVSDEPAIPVFSATVLNPLTSTASAAVTTSSHLTRAAGSAKAEWLSGFSGLSSVTTNDTTRWVLATDSLTKTLWSTTLNDSTIGWGLVYNGSDSSGTYSNWTCCAGQSATNGLSEWWREYISNTSQPHRTISVTKTSSTALTVAVTFFSAGSPGEYFYVAGNSDGSGKLSYYSNVSISDGPFFRAMWFADGSGMAESGSNGSVTGGGSW